jgi:uncharacterized membrane protein
MSLLGALASAGILALAGVNARIRTVAAWDTGGVLLLLLAWRLIRREDAEGTRCRAAEEDPGQTAVFGVVVASAFASLFAATGLLEQAKSLPRPEARLLVGLCVGAVALAWCLTHTAYAFRYAHLYYRDDDEGVGGLEYPGGQPPDFWDFAYFSFTLGMTFQVSDVAVSSRHIRRQVLLHATLSFVYNTAILALALNLIFGLFN